MIKEIRVPEISENVESGEVINTLVKVGDMVTLEQPLVELETEKAAFEVPSTAEGQVTEVLVKEGDKVKVGQVIFKIETEAKSAQQAQTAKPSLEKKASEQEPSSSPFKEPAKQEALTKEGVESESAPEPETSRSPALVPAAPSVRQLARELGIDITAVKGTGPGGRISNEDVKKHARMIITQNTSAKGGQQQAAPPTKPLPDFSKWGPIERKTASATRKKIAETMGYAWSQAARVTQHDHADITVLRELIAEYSEQVEKAGGKLTITSIMMKAAAIALQPFPELNASYDLDAEEIIYKKYTHIAVAVDTDRGLLVPVIRDADKKSIQDLSIELSQIAERARLHKVHPDEMLGGTFTITNLGGIGGTYFSPIVYWPQTAILGLSRAALQPVYTADRLEPRWMLPLSLSYDHRLVDGAQGLRFLRTIIDLLEKPFQLLLKDKDHAN